jgi:outer membrane protein OmpA-like peptidoglycan-associated protein
VLGELHAGLASESEGVIIIEGHTSSEGAAAHNLELSKRRAQAVVDDLVRRGLDRKRLRAAGKGPSVPIAPNTDENGRALNRQVEVKCVAR